MSICVWLLLTAPALATTSTDYTVVGPAGATLTDSKGNTLALTSTGGALWNGAIENWGANTAAGALGGELFLLTSDGITRDVEAGTIVANPTHATSPFVPGPTPTPTPTSTPSPTGSAGALGGCQNLPYVPGQPLIGNGCYSVLGTTPVTIQLPALSAVTNSFQPCFDNIGAPTFTFSFVTASASDKLNGDNSAVAQYHWACVGADSGGYWVEWR